MLNLFPISMNMNFLLNIVNFYLGLKILSRVLSRYICALNYHKMSLFFLDIAIY